jgi:hypothetical protein
MVRGWLCLVILVLSMMACGGGATNSTAEIQAIEYDNYMKECLRQMNVAGKQQEEAQRQLEIDARLRQEAVKEAERVKQLNERYEKLIERWEKQTERQERLFAVCVKVVVRKKNV